VLFVIESLRCGGAEKSLVSLLPLLDRNKYEIHLWMINRGGEFATLVPKDVIIEKSPRQNSLERFLFNVSKKIFSIRLRLLRKLKISRHSAETLWQSEGLFFPVLKDRYDVAVAYQQGIPTYLVSKKIKADKKIAWINTNIFQAKYDISYNVRFYNKYDNIVLVSEDALKIFNEELPQFKSKTLCVYDIINPHLIREMSDADDTDIEHQEGRYTFTTVGRLATAKNYNLAVNIAVELKRRGLNFIWYYVGGGPSGNYIRRIVKERGVSDCVKMVGTKVNPYPFIKACDVYVQTSSFEGFGLTIAEAKILHKPVVSTNFEVVYNQLTDGVNGLISDMTPESMSDKIMQMLNDDEFRTKIVNNLKREENLTYKTEVKKVEALLDED